MKRRSLSSPRGAALVLLGILAAAASPAAGDWLLTRAGGRVETKGPWQVKGKLVVFTLADGSLSSLRLADVDLEASGKATGDAKVQAGKPAAPEAAKKKLAVLTDENFRRSSSAGSAAVPPTGETQPSPSVQPDKSGPVTISAWKRVNLPGGDGIAIEGTLHNTTDHVILNASAEVQLYDDAGERVHSAAAVLSSQSIQPRATVDFRAVFPGVFTFGEMRVETQGLPLDVGSPEAQSESTAPPR